MRITAEQGIYVLLFGAAIGSFATYYLLTEEKRIIASVRKSISGLSDFHELSSHEHRRAESKEIASDQEILAFHRWAKGVCRQLKKQKIRIDASSLTAQAIICK